MLQMIDKQYLTREEAAEYVSRTGVTISKNTLTKFATVGGGPVYRRFGKRALYTRDDLDAWITERMSAPMRSTSAAA